MKLLSVGWLVGLSLISGSSSSAQATPRATGSVSQARNVLARFLTLNSQRKLKSAASKGLLTGEATRFATLDTLGRFSRPDAFKLVDSRHAVGRVQALKGNIPKADIYLHLTLSGSTWKVSALRSFALTRMIERAMQELQRKPILTDQERSALANMKLTLSIDRDLRAYFKSRRSQFERMRKVAAKNRNAAQSHVRKLGLNGISNGNGADRQFVIGGIADNTVGYLYSPTNRPPKITSDEFIWVEKIADKWFLFRTT